MKNRIYLKIPLLLLTSIFLLYGCGKGEDKEELKKKQELVVMNYYMDDKLSKEEEDKKRQKALSKMDEEQLAELKVDEELDLVDNSNGTFLMYGITENLPTFVQESIEDGLAIPKEGKVVFLDDEVSDDTYTINDDALSIALQNQKFKLDMKKLRELQKKKSINESADRIIERQRNN